MAYSGLQLREGVNFPQFFATLFSHHPLAKRAPVAQKSPTVLSKHHRMPLVRMFQTYATCAYKPMFAEFRGARRFSPDTPL